MHKVEIKVYQHMGELLIGWLCNDYNMKLTTYKYKRIIISTFLQPVNATCKNTTN